MEVRKPFVAEFLLASALHEFEGVMKRFISMHYLFLFNCAETKEKFTSKVKNSSVKSLLFTNGVNKILSKQQTVKIHVYCLFT